MSQVIKVLQIQPKYSVRASDPKEEIVNALSGDEFDITTAFLSGTSEDSEMPTICSKVKCFKLSKKKLKGLRLFAIFEIWKYCKEQQFDVIITHRFKPLYIILIVNKLLAKPAQCISIIRANGEFERPYRRFLTYIFTDKYWKYVGVSKSVKKDLLQYAKAGFTEKNVIYINNALDIKKTVAGLLDKSSAREKLGVDANAFVFGIIGRLVPIKGHAYLLDAFKKVLVNYPSAKLIIIGGGELEAKLKAYVIENNIEASVVITGNIPDAYRLLKAFDVFILTSLTEAFGLVLLEAMIARVPIIASDVGGIKHVISNKGQLIKPADTESIVNAMKRHLALESHQLDSLGRGLSIRAEEKFSIEMYRENFLKLVKDFSRQEQ